MRKMPYAILFIVILAILVFAGCKAFKLGGDDPDVSTEESTSFAEDDTTAPEEPADTTAADETEAPDESTEAPVSGMTTTEPAETTAPADVTAAPDETTTNTPAQTTTSAPVETTAKAPAETTTKAPAPTANEYDILRSGKFYLQGSMYSEGENNPIVLAVGDDQVYMQATMDGVTMGFLIRNKKTYLLNPAQNTYCEFGSMMSSLLQQAGMMSEDEIMGFIDQMGFTTMDDLDKADEQTEGTIGSTSCDVYVFNKSDGTKTRVYMNGNRLMAFEIVGENGLVESATYITSLSAETPVLPPANYTKQNVISFMTSMEDLMGE